MATTVDQGAAMDVDVENASTTAAPIVGMIYPPPDIRRTVDRAATFLASKGPQLEDRIRENEKHNARFCFLNPTDPYHAYYQYKLREARSSAGATGTGDMTTQETADHLNRPQEYEQQQPVVNVAPPQPEPYEFSVPMPAMSAQDLDIIKLTARFAARNGRFFISQLAQRESRNFQFDFLRPTHSLFPYFTELIKQYTKVLVPPEDVQTKLSQNNNRSTLLERIKQRVEWTVWDEQERKKKAEEDEKEKLAYASIDWHDFVVVETVEFTAEDEKMNLPPPMSLSELENMSLAQRRMASLSAMEDHEIPDFAAYEKALDKELGPEEPTASANQAQAPEAPPAHDQPEIHQHMVPPNIGGPIKIRTDYKPKLGQQNKIVQESQICPRCGESIPVSEMDEHMRIELLDPKWKEQKLAQEAKLRDSNLLQEGTDVAKILTNFAGYRSDIFGSNETGIGRKISEEEAARQREQQHALWEQQNAAAMNDVQSSSASPNPPGTITATPVAFNNQIPNMYNGSAFDATTAAIRKAEDDPSVQQNDIKRQRLDEQPPSAVPGGPMGSPAGAGARGAWNPPPPPLPTPSDSIHVVIQTIDYPEKPEWNLNGQTIELADLPLTMMISTVKERITSQLGIPYGKQKLSIQQTVMVNGKSLGFYGCADGTVLQLGLKDRKK